MDYTELCKSKIKSEAELIFFIKNRISDRIPNYSLLLGAGCSVTSDIGTGLDLVEKWKKEYFKLKFNSEEFSNEKLNQHLETQTDWYMSDNEYSSFFEKIYHLPVQRRKFIQSQVDGKIPSIGYAYLVSLCDKNNKYFDTIYTTNFDDLINDSFYQFGQDRPILCAHDSSVKSLSTHTERPKIIKLHGDYLYDGIKSTNVETGSLTKNTEAKFREFSKDFGLIVLGYAGNDNSVMDCIESLLKDKEADFFENGIYWCVRKGDQISDKLLKLINITEKVFLVEIDGFDEFMAKVNSTVKNDISILNEFNETKKEKIINSFVHDKYNLRKNSIINRDITSLKKKNTQKDILEYIIDFNNNDSLNTSLNDSEFKSLLNIDKSIKSEDYSNAKSICMRLLNEETSTDFKKKIFDRLISINTLLGSEYELEAIRCSDELIKIDEFESKYLVRKAYLFSDKVKRSDTLMEGYDKFQNEVFYLNTLSQSILDLIKDEISTSYTLDCAKKNILKSIELNPSISNKANLILLDIYELEYKGKKLTKENREKIKQSAYNVINNFKVNKDSVRFFDLKLHGFIHDGSVSYSKQVITELLDIRCTSRLSKQDALERMITTNMVQLHRKKGGDYKRELDSIINSDAFKTSQSVHFDLAKLFYFSYINEDNNVARDLIGKLKSNEKSHMYHDMIIDIYCDVFDNIEEAKIYLEFIKNNISQPEYYLSKSGICLLERNFKDAINHIETSYRRGLPKKSYMIDKSFTLLYFSKHEEVVDFVNSCKSCGESRDILEINKQFSLKCLGRKIDESKLNEIISKSGKCKNPDQVFELTSDKWICANIILDKNKQYNAHIINNINHYPALYYRYKKWPIIDTLKLPKKSLKIAS